MNMHVSPAALTRVPATIGVVQPDPIFVAIEHFWSTLKARRTAECKLKALAAKKGLSEMCVRYHLRESFEERKQRLDELGLWQAAARANRLMGDFCSARHKVCHTTPATMNGCIAALQFVKAVRLYAAKSSAENIDLGPEYTAVLAQLIAKTLQSIADQ